MTNYDFKSNWEQRIKPLLDTERIQKAVKKGLTTWLDYRKDCIIEEKLTQAELVLCGRDEKKLYKEKRKHYELHDKRFTYLKYNKSKLPYRYANGDCCIMFYEDEEGIIAKLIDWGILKADAKQPKREVYETDDDYEIALDEYYCNESYQEYYNYKEEIIEPYLKAHALNSYKSYCLYGGCFWWNKTFGIELARMVMPNEVWKHKKSNIHHTITNTNETLVFDILYYDENDETFGGRQALKDTE